MPRVLGIDPGTVSIDVCGLDDGRLCLDASLPTAEALGDAEALLSLLRSAGPPDLIAGPSGYGLPLIPAAKATEHDLGLAFLAASGEAGGIGGLRRLVRMLGASGLPVMLTPGVIHLRTVPNHRKFNRVDMGTAEKVAAAALGVAEQSDRLRRPFAESSFILLELGGAFTAALAVYGGRIVDGIGGTSGPMGWQAAGALDGELAYLSGRITKAMVFRGGAETIASRGNSGLGGTERPPAWEEVLSAYVEGAVKTVLALTASVPAPTEILLSGRRARDERVVGPLTERLGRITEVRELRGLAATAKQGAQGAAIIADGLMGGRYRELVERLGVAEAHGTVLDHLYLIHREQALVTLGLS